MEDDNIDPTILDKILKFIQDIEQPASEIEKHIDSNNSKTEFHISYLLSKGDVEEVSFTGMEDAYKITPKGKTKLIETYKKEITKNKRNDRDKTTKYDIELHKLKTDIARNYIFIFSAIFGFLYTLLDFIGYILYDFDLANFIVSFVKAIFK